MLKKFLNGCFTNQDGKPSFGKLCLALPLNVVFCVKFYQTHIEIDGHMFLCICAGLAMLSVAYLFPISLLVEKLSGKKVDKK